MRGIISRRGLVPIAQVLQVSVDLLQRWLKNNKEQKISHAHLELIEHLLKAEGVNDRQLALYKDFNEDDTRLVLLSKKMTRGARLIFYAKIEGKFTSKLTKARLVEDISAINNRDALPIPVCSVARLSEIHAKTTQKSPTAK